MASLNALERIPKLIEKYQTDNERLVKDLPILRDVLDSVFKKEPELKDLKTQWVALDRQILLTLTTKDESKIDAQVVASTPNPLVSNDTAPSNQPMSIKEIIDNNRARIFIVKSDTEIRKQNEDDGGYRGDEEVADDTLIFFTTKISHRLINDVV